MLFCKVLHFRTTKFLCTNIVLENTGDMGSLSDVGVCYYKGRFFHICIISVCELATWVNLP